MLKSNKLNKINFFNLRITFVNLQQVNQNLKGDFILKNRFKRSFSLIQK